MDNIDKLITFFENFEWDENSQSFKKIKAKKEIVTAIKTRKKDKKLKPDAVDFEPKFDWNPKTQSFKRIHI